MYRIDPQRVVWKEAEGTVTVLLLESGQFFELNRVGSAIWKLLDDGKSPAEITAALHASFNASYAQLETDMERFFADMLLKKLLVAA